MQMSWLLFSLEPFCASQHPAPKRPAHPPQRFIHQRRWWSYDSS